MKTFLTLAAALQLAFQKDKSIVDGVSLEETSPDEYVLLENGTDVKRKKNGQPKKKPGRKKKPRDKNGNIIKEPMLPVHKKIFVVRPTITIGEDLGFLPGDLNEKLNPFFRPIHDLLLKLHEIRPANRLFVDGDPKKGFNNRVIEFIPLNYLRGMNIEQAIVIIDEIQNLTRSEVRTLLSRMGEGVRCFLTGDKNGVSPINKQNKKISFFF